MLKIGICNKPGFPDLQVFEGRGKSSLIEVKRPGESPDPLQYLRHEEMQEYGVSVAVADCFEDIDHLYPNLHETKATSRKNRK